MKASILILNYYKAQDVLKNVESILRQKTEHDFEILVGDNSCDGEEAQLLKEGLSENPSNPPSRGAAYARDTYQGGRKGKISLHIFETNTGYTKGNNFLAKQANGEIFFFVNADITWPESDSLQKMIDKLKSDPTAGILGPKQLIRGSKELEKSMRSFPNLLTQLARRSVLGKLPFFQKKIAAYEMTEMDSNAEQEVDWLQSSCIAMRSEDFWDWGGFDQSYELFMADTELCFQCHEHEKKVLYFPKVTVEADGIRSSEGGLFGVFTNRALRIHAKDALKYWWRH